MGMNKTSGLFCYYTIEFWDDDSGRFDMIRHWFDHDIEHDELLFEGLESVQEAIHRLHNLFQICPDWRGSIRI